ncbi:HD-GYP domain-containing protein [Desulfovibrio sp. TomC]|uniref:HD-GYP domain-containing protein n=1 Tax=Desulfovibrio sp. TomC TaxID=1562888 RepID=UPI0005731E72|nr:HD-GYP domain-containing protein [Desulfovibrio sp. TomC]KHK02690.1 HDIG domain protein [Desulfovibrio sp. TomC]
MLRKIDINTLVPGMFVVDTGLSWLEHPYLYSQEGEIRSLGVVREIKAGGYTEVFIDTERGDYARSRNGAEAQEPSLAELLARGPAVREAPSVPLAQELATAQVVYRDCLGIARELLGDAEARRAMDIARPAALVDEVISSAVRNPDALLALCKLRCHDAYTFTHGVNVSVLAVAFGTSLGIGAQGLKELGLAGLFHDLGKTGVADVILNKPGRLTPDEFHQVKSHPGLGRDLLEGRGLPEAVLRGVAEHHEKWGGAGYPSGLAGEDVHAWARIIGVADVFDALTSKRAYKNAMLPTRALGVLYGMRERDYPPGLVERFIKFMGPYPVGSFVRLDSGEYAFVRGANPGRPLFPELLLAFDTAMRPVPPRVLAASSEPAGPWAIAEALDSAAFGIDPMDYLVQ